MSNDATIANVLDRLVTVAERVGESAVANAPAAMEMVGNFLQMRAIIELSTSAAIILVVPTITFFGIRAVWRKVSPNRYSEGEFFLGLATLMVVFAATLLTVAATMNIASASKIMSATSSQNALMVAAARRIEGSR